VKVGVEGLAELSKTDLVSVGELHEEGRGHTTMALIGERLRTSQPAIVVARLPSSALSLLISDAAGFIFESGGLLCHLAILLREAGKPAVFMPGALDRLAEGEWVTVPDAVDECDPRTR
jgi:phosphoenolpyruvate-protein kinase (PTS system EI component)